MKKVRFFTLTLASVVFLIAILGLSACSESTVAATVNGTEIMEDEVTEKIEASRAQNESFADDAAWATALASSDLTPESLREDIIDSLAQDIVVTQEAEAKGYTADEEAIDASIEETKRIVGGSEDTWTKALNQRGYKDEQEYREYLILDELKAQLAEDVEVEATDDELKEFIAASPDAIEGWTLADGYVDETADKTTGEDAAATSEEEAAEATEEATADEAADPAAKDTPEEATADPATEETATGEETAAETVEGTVVDGTSTADIAVEEVTYTADDVDLNAIPKEILTEYKELWVTQNEDTKFNEWVEELVEDADIVINDMPEGLSYDVDMSLAETEEESTEDTSTEETPTDPTTSLSSDEAVQAAIAEGLVITDDVVGEGDMAADGDTVRVHYTGTLEDGTVFDSNTEGDEPLEFTLGTGQVIKGWDAGVVGMQVGGTRTLVIPASLAYGDTGSNNIPAGATLTFTVELVEVVHNN